MIVLAWIMAVLAALAFSAAIAVTVGTMLKTRKMLCQLEDPRLQRIRDQVRREVGELADQMADWEKMDKEASEDERPEKRA